MKTNYKPANYNSVSPYFLVEDPDKLIENLTTIFDGKVVNEYRTPEGRIMHCEFQIDDTILMFGTASDQYPANTHMMHVYVSDVDEVYEKAMKLGYTSVEVPSQKNIGGDTDRRGSFLDEAGNYWSVATQQ